MRDRNSKIFSPSWAPIVALLSLLCWTVVSSSTNTTHEIRVEDEDGNSTTVKNPIMDNNNITQSNSSAIEMEKDENAQKSYNASQAVLEEEEGLPPLPPEELNQTPLQSFLSSGGELKSLLESQGFSIDNPPDPNELNRLLAKLRPKQGRFDPALMDIINNNNPNGFLPSLPVMFSRNEKRRKGKGKVKQNLWSPSSDSPPSETKTRARFSAKFKSNETMVTTTSPPPETAPRPINKEYPRVAITHVSDPNIRNHRLFDWEFSNFTDIDRDEDLMAESAEINPVIVKPGNKGEMENGEEGSTTPGWIPGTRPVPMEGSHLDESIMNEERSSSIPPNTYVKFPTSDSEEAPFNLLRPKSTKRPREPLRESSTENFIYTPQHDPSSIEKRKRLHKFRSEEALSQPSFEDKGHPAFRPNPKDNPFSPPVFIDPDQDFFTSTIRNNESPNVNEREQEKELHSFYRPMRNSRGSNNRNRMSIPMEEGEEEQEHRFQRNRRPNAERIPDDMERDPRPYPPVEETEDRLPPPLLDERPFLNQNTRVKADRILNTPYGDQSEHHPSYVNYNFYPSYGPASNEKGYQEEDMHTQYQDKNGILVDHNGEQVYAGSHQDQFQHPFADLDNQPEYSSYAPTSNEGWTNTYWVLAALILLSALIAFLLPALLKRMGRTGKNRDDIQDGNLEYMDEPTTSASASSSTLASLFGMGGDGSNSQEPNKDSDLWSEIKGVYNDVLKIVKGDYGGMVDKLSGTWKGNKNKDKLGPNIVYRDDNNDALTLDDLDMLDDDYEVDYKKRRKKKNKLRHRKGNKGESHKRRRGRRGRGKPKLKKNRRIKSTINYVVSNTSPRSISNVYDDLEEEEEEETPRSVGFNDSMATFYFPPSSSSSTPFSLFANPSQASTANNNAGPSSSASPQGFMNEWAKVQLIGS